MQGYASGESVRNGLTRGQQRYRRCMACGLNFTATPPRGKPLALKIVAVLLYVSGLVLELNPRMNRTAKLLGVSTPTVQAWIERFARAYAPKPEPQQQQGRALVIELDGMGHRPNKSPGSSGYGRLTIALWAAWLTDSAAVAIALPWRGC